MFASAALICLCMTQKLAATEPHLHNIRQLTFGGDNAEAYFSPDGKKLAFQSNFKGWGHSCDQIHALTIADAKDSSYRPPLISTGKGRTTCSYFLPDGKHILYASTHLASEKHVRQNRPLAKTGSIYGRSCLPTTSLSRMTRVTSRSGLPTATDTMQKQLFRRRAIRLCLRLIVAAISSCGR